ncbi:MAG TPA: heavy-metal-associated domain-containing protein [Actinomycetales bacterium]|jgi:copper ion binding protein|nr:heavy-metal-associated domain-containing protein [Actinomycetales bacterium]
MDNTPRTFVGSTSFQVTGMTCGHCVHAVITEVGKVAGVQTVSVDLPSGVVTVETTEPVDRADVAAAIDEAGYTLQP